MLARSQNRSASYFIRLAIREFLERRLGSANLISAEGKQDINLEELRDQIRLLTTEQRNELLSEFLDSPNHS